MDFAGRGLALHFFPAPAPGLFLHGWRDGADDVAVVWRTDLEVDRPATWLDHVAVLPPLAGEGCPVPFAAARAWLGGRQPPGAADADVPGTTTAEPATILTDQPSAGAAWTTPR